MVTEAPSLQFYSPLHYERRHTKGVLGLRMHNAAAAATAKLLRVMLSSRAAWLGLHHTSGMPYVGSALQLLDELYHTDKGYSRSKTVVLCDKPPGHDVRHVLYTHDAYKKVMYLQGSPFQQKVRVSGDC